MSCELRVLLASGKDTTRTFPASLTVGDVKNNLLNDWPEGMSFLEIAILGSRIRVTRPRGRRTALCALLPRPRPPDTAFPGVAASMRPTDGLCVRHTAPDFDKVNSISELRLIHAGKVLDNSKTLQQCGVSTENLTNVHLAITPQQPGAEKKDGGSKKKSAPAAGAAGASGGASAAGGNNAQQGGARENEDGEQQRKKSCCVVQ